MMENGDANGGTEIAPASGFFTELSLAVGFLTILPVIDNRRASEDAVAASFEWFPLIGFILGLALCGEDVILSYAFGQVMRSVLVVLSLVVITGAVHLDGLADTADALGAGRDRERALEILQDSRIGTFGAIAIFFDLILKILALSTLAGSARYFALILAPGLARYAMVLVSRQIDYLRSAGAGSTLLADPGARWPQRKFVFISSMIFVLAAKFQGAKALLVAAAVVIAMRRFYKRWLGGVTGDLIGACGEVVEIAVLVGLST
jgi:adenosylcobinamide-GDP ribazoletransferase